MKHRRIILTASLLTVGFAVAPATLWVLRHRSSYGKQRSADMPLASAQVVSAAGQAEDANPLDKAFTVEDRLSYKDYVIEKFPDAGEESWFATLKRGDKVLAKFEGGWIKDATNFGLFPFLGNDSKQLVIEQYSGGAHCCYSYWVYDLSANARPLFESEKYGTGNSLSPVDIDGDGVFELEQSVMAFDYFHVSHASSVFPAAIFAYDRKTGKYLPANRKFSAYALRGIEDDIKAFQAVKAEGEPKDVLASEKYFSAVLQVTLKYIYAGKRDEGWSFFEQEYREHQGISRDKMRAEIKKELQGEPVYTYIYSKDTE